MNRRRLPVDNPIDIDTIVSVNTNTHARQQMIARLENAICGGEGAALCCYLADQVITRTVSVMPAAAQPIAYANTARLCGFKLTQTGGIAWNRKAALRLIESLQVDDGSDPL